MAVIKEWECKAHGYFDGTDPACPHGCPEQFVQRVFLTPPAIGSARTQVVDSTLRGLAKDFGMTDIRNGSEGESVASQTPASSAGFKIPERAGFVPVQQNFDVRGLGIQPGNALKPFQGTLKGPKPSEIVGRYDG